MATKQINSGEIRRSYFQEELRLQQAILDRADLRRRWPVPEYAVGGRKNEAGQRRGKSTAVVTNCLHDRE
jgi:hypothetical protein